MGISISCHMKGADELILVKVETDRHFEQLQNNRGAGELILVKVEADGYFEQLEMRGADESIFVEAEADRHLGKQEHVIMIWSVWK